MTIGCIKADLRTTCPVTPLSATLPPSQVVRPCDPLICMRAFGSDPHTAHTTLAVTLRPLASSFQGSPPRIRRPTLSADGPESTNFLGSGRLLPSSGLQITTRPCLRAPMGSAWQRLRLSLFGRSSNIAKPCTQVPLSHAFSERLWRLEAGRLPILLLGLRFATPLS